MISEANAFLNRVSKLRGPDRSALKRAVGKPLNEANAAALSAFYRCLSRDTEKIPKWQEDRWFAVACFRCLWDAPAASIAPMEKVISNMIASGELYDSTKHKIEVLLDYEWESADNYMMLTKLTRLIKMIRSKTTSELPIDLALLLSDLIYWNSDRQYVQRRWAREIFALVITEDDET